MPLTTLRAELWGSMGLATWFHCVDVTGSRRWLFFDQHWPFCFRPATHLDKLIGSSPCFRTYWNLFLLCRPWGPSVSFRSNTVLV